MIFGTLIDAILVVVLIAFVMMYIFNIRRSSGKLHRIIVTADIVFAVVFFGSVGALFIDSYLKCGRVTDDYDVSGDILGTWIYEGVVDEEIEIECNGFLDTTYENYSVDSVEVADNVSVGSAVYIYTDRETNEAVQIVRNYGPEAIITAFLTFVITIFGNVVFYFIVLARRGNR